MDWDTIILDHRPDRWVKLDHKLVKENREVSKVWKKISEEKLENGIHVLLAVQYGKNKLVTRGFFAEEGKFCADDFENAEDHEYDAEKDHYFLKEGYYEDNLESENVYFITHEVTHWMPFSLPQEEIETNGHQ